ncbi:MAG: DUF3857 domain-containing protein [Armatimonadota bacterium]
MRALRIFLCLLLPLVLSLAAVAAADAPDIYSLLWQNKHADARALCESTLKKDSNDARALLGLALISHYEDAPLAALQAWQRYYMVAPDSWQAAAYWPRMLDLAQYTARWSMLADIAQHVVAAPNVSPEMRACARQALVLCAKLRGTPADSEKLYAPFGYVRKWMIIGPFDNVSLSGFSKAYPPEGEIDFAKSYQGIDDLDLSWYPLKLISPDGTCNIGEALGDTQESVFYAATAVNSPKNQEVHLSFDYSGAAKIFLNGRCVYSNDKYLEAPYYCTDAFHFPVTLQQGWNTILVKTVSNDTQMAYFTLRFITPAGADITDLVCDSKQVKSVVSSGEAPAIDDSTSAMLRKLPQSPETALALGYRLREISDYQASANALHAAVAQYPEIGWLHWELSLTLYADEQADEARAERDLARKHNTCIAAAEENYLDEQADSLSSAEYLTQLKALCARFPASPSLRWTLSDAYNDEEMESETFSTAQTALSLAPGAWNVDRLTSLYDEYERSAEAMKALMAALQAAPSSMVLLSSLANYQQEQKKQADAVATYRKLLLIEPADSSYRSQLAGCYVALRDYKQAALQYALLREQCPQDADICAAYANVLRELHRSNEAIELYRLAVRLNPSNIDWREKIQVLTGGKPVVDLASPTPADPILAKAATLKAPPKTSAICLLDEERQVIYPDFATDTRAHMIIKVFTDAGVRQFSHISMRNVTATSDDTVEKARVIKADGKIQDVTDDCDYGGISFPSLAPGDTIEVMYRISDAHSGALARHFWDDWWFSADDLPVALSRYVLITPLALTFQTREHGEVPKPISKDVDGWRIHEWQAVDIPADRSEQMGTSERDRGRWLDISTIGSWSDIVRWYRDLSGPMCIPDEAIRARAAELTKDAATEQEKIKKLVLFVAREIKYQSRPFRMSAFIPTKGKQVLRERYGDCKDKAALLSALLAAVGIKSDIVLVSGRSDGLTPYLPSPRFNHAITRIETATGPIWVDATADQMSFGGFPFEDQGVPALIIRDATTELTSTPQNAAEISQVISNYNLTLGTDGTLAGSLALSATGNWAWMMRTYLKEIPEGQHDQLLKAIAANSIHKNVLYDSGSLIDLTDPDKPLVMNLKFKVENYSSAAGDFLLARLPWQGETQGFDTILNDKDRTQDLEAAIVAGRRVFNVRLELPAGYSVQGLKPKLESVSPWGKYAISYQIEGKVLTAQVDIIFSAMRVPLSDIPKYREFVRTLVQETEKPLVLKKD